MNGHDIKLLLKSGWMLKQCNIVTLTMFVKTMSPFSMGGFSSFLPSGWSPSWCSSLEHLLCFLKLMCRLEGPGSCTKNGAYIKPKGKHHSLNSFCIYSRVIFENNQTIRPASYLWSGKWPFSSLEMRGKPGPVNYCKDFWNCYWGQGNNLANSSIVCPQ